MYALLLSFCLAFFGGDGPKHGPVVVNKPVVVHIHRPAIFGGIYGYGLAVPVTYQSAYSINYVGNIAVIHEYRVGYNIHGAPITTQYYVHYRYRW